MRMLAEIIENELFIQLQSKDNAIKLFNFLDKLGRRLGSGDRYICEFTIDLLNNKLPIMDFNSETCLNISDGQFSSRCQLDEQGLTDKHIIKFSDLNKFNSISEITN